MATCLDNLIGIKSVCAGATGYDFYIEDIGITADEAGFYINSNYKNGVELITDKIRLATDLVRKTIANHFAPHIISKSLLESKKLGVYQDSLNLKSGSASTLGGISVTLNNTKSYFNLFVNEISLQVNVTQDVPVFVYDLISGTQLDSFTVSCTANKISSKTINKLYSSPKRKLDLIFVYDTEGISSNTTLLSDVGCTHCNGYKYTNAYIESAPVYLSELDTKIRSSLTNGTHTFGLSINYSIQCSIENWLCESSNLMVMPILYKTGEEIMNYACYYSNRQNSNINIDAERNKERLALYQSAFNEAIEATIKKMNLPKYDPCFKCEEYVRSVVVLP